MCANKERHPRLPRSVVAHDHHKFMAAVLFGRRKAPYFCNCICAATGLHMKRVKDRIGATAASADTMDPSFLPLVRGEERNRVTLSDSRVCVTVSLCFDYAQCGAM